MARETLAIQTLTSSGVIPAWSTPTVDGFKVSNDGMTHIHVKNGNAATCTVTVTTPTTVDGLAVADRTIAILTTAEKEFVLPPTFYNQPDSAADRGMVYLDFSVQTSVSVKATHH
jgi:hypothetical protein